MAVELGNAWREAQVAEQAEIERILDELSTVVAGQAGPLRETLDALARFDFWAAKARLAEEMDAIAGRDRRPAGDRAARRAPSRVCPATSCRSTSASAASYTALLITGPNTGGKTVALRTLGLLSLMHQSGLHVPADAGTQAAGPARHLRRHRRRAVGGPVALDVQRPPALDRPDRRGGRAEQADPARRARRRHGPDRRLGAGPGAAGPLHQGRARWSPRRPTTPSSSCTPTRRPQARNASVEFDVETLRPTYRLSIGLPGQSQAFAIAERLGLPGRDRGRRAITPDRRAAGLRGDAGVDQGHRSSRRPKPWPAPGWPRSGPGRPWPRPRRSGAARSASARNRQGGARRGRAAGRRGPRRGPRASGASSSARRSPSGAWTRTWSERQAQLDRLPGVGAEPEPSGRTPAEPIEWRIGMRARSVGRGLGGPGRGAREGRQAGHARGRRDADHRPGRRSRAGRRRGRGARRGRRRRSHGPSPARRGSSGSASRLQFERARTVASSLDLRGAKVGRGAGGPGSISRRRVAGRPGPGHDHPRHGHRARSATPCGSTRRAIRWSGRGAPGGRGEGGDGATVVAF